MDWTLITKDKYVVSEWSGGTTTQLAIYPESALYADRDFLWRLSSAEVRTPESDFTPLPDYDRLISVVSGKMELTVGGAKHVALEPLEVFAFDGGTPVKSRGLCSDFNLMMRKGKCRGTIETFALEAKKSFVWTPKRASIDSPGDVFGNVTPDTPCDVSHDAPCISCLHLAIYCADGEVDLPDECVTARKGEMLLCKKGAFAPLRMGSNSGCSVFAASAELL